MDDFIPRDNPQYAKNLKKFHGKTPDVIKNSRWYHGTDKDFQSFRPNTAGIMYVTPDPSFANRFTNSDLTEKDLADVFEASQHFGAKPPQSNIMPVHVRAEKPFDYENKKHIRALYEKLGPDLIFDPFLHSQMDDVRDGHWSAIENPKVQDAIKAMGHDSFFVKEHGVKNLGVYDPTQIKSALGNFGGFNREEEDINKAYGGALGDEDDDEGIDAFHGSPHNFPRFDLSKVGTGEGAQSYGHGLYFSESEPFAESYRDRLGKEEETSGESMADQYVIEPHFYKNMDEDEIAENMKEASKWAGKRIFEQGKMKYLFDDGSMLIHDDDGVRAVQKQPGHMYNVRIKAKPEHFIDWDAPISEQDPYVWSKLAKEAPDFIKSAVRKGIAEGKTWGDIHGSIAVKHPRGQQGVTEHLAELGIPGVRYIDQNSSSAGKGTRNYVVFDDKLVDIKRKYELGGSVDDEDDDEGITAYHGSPHNFQQFDLSKIGTGEGNQTFGHGLYFAEAEPVANTYRGDPEERYRRFSGHMDPKEEYAFDLASHAGEKTDWDIMKGLAAKYGEGISYEDAEKLAKNAIAKRGHMYEVRIKAKPEHMLDWDTPLESQPMNIRDAIDEALLHAENKAGNRKFMVGTFNGALFPEKNTVHRNFERLTGGAIHDMLSKVFSPEELSQRLSESGIKGIRYLDQNSRQNREGTRNYVIFDDKLVNVKRKYDKGGTVKNLFNPNYIPHDDPRRAQNLENFMPMKDENGEPMKVFHNTNREFSEFNTKSSELGTHFGTANQAANLQANQDNPLAKRRTMAAHISLRNPLRLTDQGGFSVERVAQQLYDMGMINDKKYDKHMEGDFRSEEAAIKDLQNVIKKAGHDGIVYLNRREGLSQHPDPETNQKNLMWHFAMGSRATDDEFKQKFPEAEDSYIIFEPNQAKNAVGNVGTFDPNQKDFNKARGGIVAQTGRIKRNTGGRIPEMDKLFKRAKKYVDEQTKPMLNLHDDVIVKALNLAKKKI